MRHPSMRPPPPDASQLARALLRPAISGQPRCSRTTSPWGLPLRRCHVRPAQAAYGFKRRRRGVKVFAGAPRAERVGCDLASHLGEQAGHVLPQVPTGHALGDGEPRRTLRRLLQGILNTESARRYLVDDAGAETVMARTVLGIIWRSWGCLGAFAGVLGSSQAAPAAPRKGPGRSRGLRWHSWGVLGASWVACDAPGTRLGLPGELLARPGVIPGRSWGISGVSRGPPGRPWAPPGSSRRGLGGPGRSPGGAWGSPWRRFRAPRAPLSVFKKRWNS